MNKLLFVLASLVGLVTNAFATGPDYTALTAAVDFTTTIAAILAVAALLASPLIARKGARLIMGFFGR